MNKPTIELKKLKFGAAHSHQETINFVADLYVNGKHVGYCENEGRGGSTNIRPVAPYDTNNVIINIADDYFKNNPPADWKYNFKYDLENHVDEIVSTIMDEKESEKFLKSINKKTLNHLVFVNEKKTDAVTLKYNKNISELYAHPAYKLQLDTKIKEVLKKYPGYTLLNKL